MGAQPLSISKDQRLPVAASPLPEVVKNAEEKLQTKMLKTKTTNAKYVSKMRFHTRQVFWFTDANELSSQTIVASFQAAIDFQSFQNTMDINLSFHLWFMETG